MRRSPSRRNMKISTGKRPAGQACSTNAPMRRYAHKLAQLDLADPVRHARARAPRPASTRSNPRWTSLRSRSSSIRWNCACAAIRIATRTPTSPFSSKALRELLPPGRRGIWLGQAQSPKPRSMRDGSELVGWGMATGVWEALQMPITVRIALTANGHAEVAVRDLRHRHRHLHDHGAGRGRHARTAARSISDQARRLRPCRNRRSKADRGSRPRSSNGIATTADAIREELLRLAKQMPNSPLANVAPGDVDACGRQAR